MKAIVSTKYGRPEILKLREVEKPTPKKNEVLVKIIASSITRADAMMRTGKPYIGRLIMGFSKPKHPIAGTGFAGIIEDVGAEVNQFKKGDKVFGESIANFGAYAEFICVPQNGIIAKLPSQISFNEAAPICDGALTSLNFIKHVGNIKAEQKILINGASGSLGTAAIQIAKYYGAEVTAVCSTTNIEMVKKLGADHVIDYTQKEFTATTNTYHVIYDTVGKSTYKSCKKALTKNGAYISPVLSGTLIREMLVTKMYGKKKAKFCATGTLAPHKLNSMLQEVLEIIEAGKLKTVLDKTFSLEQTPMAHSYIDQGHKKGNVVISMLND